MDKKCILCKKNETKRDIFCENCLDPSFFNERLACIIKLDNLKKDYKYTNLKNIIEKYNVNN